MCACQRLLEIVLESFFDQIAIDSKRPSTTHTWNRYKMLALVPDID